VTRSLTQLKIPPTGQGILASRIDRLSPEAKDLLQTLAVIGTEFPLSLVRQVVQRPDEWLDHMLGDLQTGEFIYEQPAAGDVEYRFKHALTHQAAYDALLGERRRLLHERTAKAIEALYRERLEDHLRYHRREPEACATIGGSQRPRAKWPTLKELQRSHFSRNIRHLDPPQSAASPSACFAFARSSSRCRPRSSKALSCCRSSDVIALSTSSWSRRRSASALALVFVSTSTCWSRQPARAFK
jgi:hypothetical protein